MNEAIRFCRNWSSGNTMVTTIDGDSFVHLHGNHIATINRNGVTIFDGGWQSNTTKSRLNAILNEFTKPHTGRVFQNNFEWFISDCDGAQPFTNGYHFSAV